MCFTVLVSKALIFNYRIHLTIYITNSNITISNTGGITYGKYSFKSFINQKYDNL